MLTKFIKNVDDRWTEKHTIIDDHLLELFFKPGQKGKTEFCLIIDDLRNDVITSAMDVDFLNFYNQQKYMIIGFPLIYNFNLSLLKHNFSRSYKLLHVFWNTLYM